jgi:hypothetical protein
MSTDVIAKWLIKISKKSNQLLGNLACHLQRKPSPNG